MAKFTDAKKLKDPEDRDTPYGKHKAPSKISPTEISKHESGMRKKKLRKGSLMEKIVQGYAKGAGSDCR